MGDNRAAGTSGKRRRALLLALTAIVLPAGTCDDNLGSVSPGPVTFRVSVGTDGLQGIGHSSQPSVSRDGRYVAFSSKARNLTLSPTDFQEIFVRDRVRDRVENISNMLAIFGDPSLMADCEGPVISGNGRFVAFLTTVDLSGLAALSPPAATPPKNVMVWDREQELWEVIHGTNWPDADIQNLSISYDGRKLAFQTSASNLGLDSNGADQVILADFTISSPPALRLISRTAADPNVAAAGREPSVSPDGAWVAFASSSGLMTADPTNGKQQIFLSDADATLMAVVSRHTGAGGATSDNHCLRPAVSQGAAYVSFIYHGGTLTGQTGFQVVRRNRADNVTEFVGDDPFVLAFFGPGGAARLGMSDDGRTIAYLGVAPGATDLEVVVRDMGGIQYKPSTTFVPPSGVSAAFPEVGLSGDGRWVVWSSEATNQVFDDTNNVSDVFGFGPLR